MPSYKCQAMALLSLPLFAALAACTNTRGVAGSDRPTRSDAVEITWSDSKSAYSITCESPEGCQTRADALCKSSYTVLKSENMPSIGTRMTPLGKPSVVVRCGG
jgi:hypothetical protein